MSYLNDLAFGRQSEANVQSRLETYFERKLVRGGRFAPFDYNDGSTLFVELKTRRIPHNKYPTAILGANKVEIAEKNPSHQYWFCYSYEDGIFGIPYSKEVFDTFEHSDYLRGERDGICDRPQHVYFIPSTSLKRLF